MIIIFFVGLIRCKYNLISIISPKSFSYLHQSGKTELYKTNINCTTSEVSVVFYSSKSDNPKLGAFLSKNIPKAFNSLVMHACSVQKTLFSG